MKRTRAYPLTLTGVGLNGGIGQGNGVSLDSDVLDIYGVQLMYVRNADAQTAFETTIQDFSLNAKPVMYPGTAGKMLICGNEVPPDQRYYPVELKGAAGGSLKFVVFSANAVGPYPCNLQLVVWYDDGKADTKS